mgnify:FL=1
MNKLIVLFFFIPTLSWGLTFSDGKQVSDSKQEDTHSIEWTNWGKTENHLSSVRNEWSQMIDKNFSRLGDFSHKFELRANECYEYDCSRGDYEGAYGRVEAYLNNPKKNNYLGEEGENWYVWSVYIDGSDIKDLTDKHLIQFAQFKLSYSIEVLAKKWPHCEYLGEVVFIMKYKAGTEGLGMGRDICKQDYLYEHPAKKHILVNKDKLFNQWLDFIVHAKWGEDGFLKMYINGDLQYSAEGFISNEFRVPRKQNKFAGPSFRYGVYVNNVPKNFDGKAIAWYSNIARAKKCSDNKFSNIINQLGYSCESLADIDGIIVKPNIVINPDAHPEFD